MTVTDYEFLLRNAHLSADQLEYMLSLTDEQRAVVKDDSTHAIVTAAAGSGKTRVLVAKYFWLTRVRKAAGAPLPKVLYLSFNRKNVEGTRREMSDRLGIPRAEAEDVTSTFHSLALKVMKAGEGVWPKLLEGVKEAWDESWKSTWASRRKVSKINHQAAEVFLKELESKLDMERIGESYTRQTRRARNYPEHRYVCYAKDRNGIPGSCRSEAERDIFTFLVNERVDFAYEEYDSEVGDRTDFTIYFRRKGEGGRTERTKVYYEHFTAEHAEDFDGNVSAESADKYATVAQRKITDMEKSFGDRFFYTSGGDDFRKVITEKLAELEVTYGSCRVSRKRAGGAMGFSQLFEDVVMQFKDVRALILETGQRIDDVLSRIEGKDQDVDDYVNDIFSPLEDVYRSVIATPPPAGPISDFADSLSRAAAFLQDGNLGDRMGEFLYDWVLVDEYQDISPSRLALLKGLKALSPSMKLLAVGDDWQTINSFAGSDIRLFRNFGDDWEGSVSFPLSETFRFGEPLLGASTLFARGGDTAGGHEVRGASGHGTGVEFVSGISGADGDISWKTAFIKKTLSLFSAEETCFVLSRFKPRRDDGVWTTMHKSKGETVDYVFIRDCNDGAIPYDGNAGNALPADRMKEMVRMPVMSSLRKDEERRLFYVALTRARKKVWLLRDEDRKPSKFFREIRKYVRQYENNQANQDN